MDAAMTSADMSGARCLLRLRTADPRDVVTPAPFDSRRGSMGANASQGAGTVTNGAQRGAGHTSQILAAYSGLRPFSMAAAPSNRNATETTFRVDSLPGLRLGAADAYRYSGPTEIEARIRELEFEIDQLSDHLSSTPRHAVDERQAAAVRREITPVRQQSMTSQFPQHHAATGHGDRSCVERRSNAAGSCSDPLPPSRAVSFAHERVVPGNDRRAVENQNFNWENDFERRKQVQNRSDFRDADQLRRSRSPGSRADSRDVGDSSAFDTHSSEVAGGMDRKRFIKPEKFDGTSSLETFLAQFENCARYNGWSEHDKAAFLHTSLSGQAGQLLWVGGRLATASYEQIVSKLEQRFGAENQEEKFEIELRGRRRLKKETLQELAQDIRRLTTLAYPNDTSRTVERIAKDAFLTALGDSELELKLREREPRDLDSAFRMAMRLETYEKVVNKDAASAPNSSPHEPQKTANDSSCRRENVACDDTRQHRPPGRQYSGPRQSHRVQRQEPSRLEDLHRQVHELASAR